MKFEQLLHIFSNCKLLSSATQTKTCNSTRIFQTFNPTYLFDILLDVSQVMNHERTYAPCNRTNPIGKPHQDAGVFRCYVQVIDVEAGYGESTERHTNGQGDYGLRVRFGKGHHEKERRFHPESAAVKKLPHLRGGEGALFP